MPITKSAIKKVKVDARKQGFNKIVRTKALGAIKLFKQTPNKKDLPALFSAIDKQPKRKSFIKRKPID